VGAVASVIFGFGLFPQLVLFFGQMFVSRDGALNYYLDNDEVIWQATLALGVFALYYALISVALASLTDRRVVGAIAFVGVMLIPAGIVRVPVALADGDPAPAALLSLITPPRILRDVIFLGEVHHSDPLSGVAGGAVVALLIYLAVVALAAYVLVWRYREVEL
jgi:hypothetical protein